MFENVDGRQTTDGLQMTDYTVISPCAFDSGGSKKRSWITFNSSTPETNLEQTTFQTY